MTMPDPAVSVRHAHGRNTFCCIGTNNPLRFSASPLRPVGKLAAKFEHRDIGDSCVILRIRHRPADIQVFDANDVENV
jgi:hypothetical protein